MLHRLGFLLDCKRGITYGPFFLVKVAEIGQEVRRGQDSLVQAVGQARRAKVRRRYEGSFRLGMLANSPIPLLLVLSDHVFRIAVDASARVPHGEDARTSPGPRRVRRSRLRSGERGRELGVGVVDGLHGEEDWLGKDGWMGGWVDGWM
jgi:hypothetical protein